GALSCKYVLLLNPDAVLLNDLDPMRVACDQPRAAGAGGYLVGIEGKPQTGFMFRRLPTPAALIMEVLLLNRVWPLNPVNRSYRALDLKCDSMIPVEQPAGAFLMIRRQVWEELGGFDEGFHPLWFEDVDFCRRAIDRGYVFYCTHQSVAKHLGGHSIPQLSVQMRRIYWYRSLLRYTAKHYRPVSFRAVCLAVIAGSFARGFVESLARRSLQPLATGGQVARIAFRCLFFGWKDRQHQYTTGSPI